MDDRTRKYLNGLQKLHEILQYTDRVSILDLAKRLEISGNAFSILSKEGIINNNGSHKYPKWEWVSIEPNIHMAEKLVEKCRKNEKKNNDLYLEKQGRGKKEKPVVEVNNTKSELPSKVHYYQGKIGWFKFKIIPVYK